MTVQLLNISSALNVLQHVIRLLLRYTVPAFWLANVPGVAGIDHMVSFLCAPLVTALCFKEVLIFGNDDFQCLLVSDSRLVWHQLSLHSVVCRLPASVVADAYSHR